MHYVVLEVESFHEEGTLKDQTRIINLSYQIVNIDDSTLLAQTNPVASIAISNDSENFQDALVQLDSDIKTTIGQNEFVICTLNSLTNLRVTLRRQALDIGVNLPQYLRYPKLFDLWVEFKKFCANHPELDLNEEMVTSKDVAILTDILGLQSNNTENYTIDISTDVLLSLYKKCSSSEDIKFVLTQPYDLQMDIKTFYEEEARVIFISNLPPDITQNELETWFANHNSKPICYWTSKTPDEYSRNFHNNTYVMNQHSIIGFIIFQTHEEAKQSLLLNGKSISSSTLHMKQLYPVEHIIEVAPSSTKVLDHTQDILIPFPQSKNKPRLGDWNCPSCGFSNFQRRTACFRCSFPAPNNSNTNNTNNGESNNNTQTTGEHTNTSPHSSLQQAVHHSPYQTYNKLNDSVTGSLNQQTYRYSNNNNSNIKIHNTANFNMPFTSYTGNGSSVPFRAGDWKCPSCTYHNFAKNIACLRCGDPKLSGIHQDNNTKNNITNNSNNFGFDNRSRNNKAFGMKNHTNIDKYLKTSSLPSPYMSSSNNEMYTKNEGIIDIGTTNLTNMDNNENVFNM
ncbi:Nrp1p NDAI_0A01900 [Naumovozyma dairenensis CBS 421]|uniref:Asparagine-rich protein n=1 Tax=Naumovozyma dairenensis (strain ATCC 10597 / BCRC 20456 / CBS 421 / NBRC 0211 / NRRL Y-12639) TaxID=1071378 RepID=G0W3G0_NAUDC|nr:hypothetical protein NDAI_0A01900 [Naumovozyma dairenensis CBS 421]CCD22348.1 hypothetical protein NDAI_0A01900 [Naumovozyma dairenensis CBS 421]